MAAGVRDAYKHILMNHSPKRGHVGDRYSNADLDDLCRAAEDVAAFLLEKAGVVGLEKRNAG